MSDTVLKLENVTKFFPGIKALDGVHLNIRPGEVHALIGENGAGKSTLVKILTGVHPPTSGKITFKGQQMSFRTAVEAQDAGITAIHQEASMFPELSVTENIYMGHHIKGGKLGTLSWRQMRKKTAALLERMELDINPDTLVKNLGTAQRHMVEIAKALSIDADVVIMDEPTSALSLREVEDLYKIVRQLKADGKAIIFISHKFEEIFEICDYFTVLRDGKYIGEGLVSDHCVDDIVTMMVGRSLDQMFPDNNAEKGEEILHVEKLGSEGVFKDISFSLRKGEVLGFFGLVGAGRTEVMRAIFGIDKITSGEIKLRGSRYKPNFAGDAMKQNIAYVPEDRQTQGVILEMSIARNITLPQINNLSRAGVISSAREKEVSVEYGSMMEIKAAGWNVDADTLSGGNQQKVVLAKWLATEPEILILDEPTKGIDVATKAAVHKFISELAAEGLAVIMVSSELPEILGMSDRIIVMHEGEITAEFSKDEADSDKIIKAATGHSDDTEAC